MEQRSHYPCRLRLHGAFVFLIWYSDDRDGFVRDHAGRLVIAGTPDALLTVASAKAYPWTSMTSPTTTSTGFARGASPRIRRK